MTPLTMNGGTPPAEIAIDAALVRILLQAQHSDLADLPIQPMGSGWDNTLFRLGAAMTVRLPRRKAAAELIRHEQMWLPKLAPQLTLPVPLPLRKGVPSAHYPYPWSVLPWIEGESADGMALNSDQAVRFGAFLRSLHTPAPHNAPHNPFRGVPLQVRSPKIQTILHQLEIQTTLITPTIKQLWREAISAPVALETSTEKNTEKKWLHGDLHPRNILVKEGAISGIIDWGDVTAGDVATDLAAVWMLFPHPTDQALALSKYGASEIEIMRAKGWAIFFAAVLLQTGLVDNPRNAAIGESILQHLQMKDPRMP